MTIKSFIFSFHESIMWITLIFTHKNHYPCELWQFTYFSTHPMCSVLPQHSAFKHSHWDYIIEESFSSILHAIIFFRVHSEALQTCADSRAAAAGAPERGFQRGKFRRFAARLPDLVEQNGWCHWIQRGRNHEKPLIGYKLVKKAKSEHP